VTSNTYYIDIWACSCRFHFFELSFGPIIVNMALSKASSETYTYSLGFCEHPKRFIVFEQAQNESPELRECLDNYTLSI